MRKLLNFHNIAFFLILIISLIVRLNNFDYPIANGETHRDYLVARHIVKYFEFPLTGPCCLWNGAFGEIRNSPVYYYLTAAIVSIQDDILFLGAVNLILQLGSVFASFFLAKKLFGQNSAIIATLLFSASSEVLRQAKFFWQPHLMQPFVNFSYLILALSYFRKSYSLLLVSIFLLFTGGAIHNAAFGILPIFYFAIFLILRTQKRKTFHYSFVIFFSLASLFLLYSPWIVHLIREGAAFNNLIGAFERFLVSTPVEFFQNFVLATTTLIQTLWQNSEKSELWLSGLSGLAVLACIPIYFANFKKFSNEKKVFFLIIFFGLLQFLLVAGVFRARVWSFYFAPIFSPFLILLAEVINSTLLAKPWLKVLKFLLILILIQTFSANFNFPKTPSFANFQAINLATQAIEKKVFEVKNSQGYDNFNFFQIKVYSTGVESPVTSELVFWSKLEKDLDKKFLKIVDGANSYYLINNNNYLFLICQSTFRIISEDEECIRPFFQEFPKHQILEKIYSNQLFAIYFAKYKDNPNRMRRTI